MNIEEVWRQYQSNIKAFLHSKIDNPAEVDDLLQEVLIKTYKNLSSLESADRIQAWLFQIASRTVIDFYRKSGRAQDISADELWYGEVDSDTQQALAQCIEPFLELLPEDSAKLLVTIDIQGQSQKEYANKERISYSTLKSRVQKARGQLRKRFEDCCHLSVDRYGNLADFEPKTKNCKKC